MKILILAGGCGSRLWPLSRGRYPKQYIKLQGKTYSLFQETYKRSLMLTTYEDIYIVTNEKYKFITIGAIEELGLPYLEENIIIEPMAKNTLPAIYAGVFSILKKNYHNDHVLVLPSDHNILEDQSFVETIESSFDLSMKHLITFGIKATTPNTGYGYISPGDALEIGYHVSDFKEKPDLENAKAYIEKGYFWNAGIFMFSLNVFQEEAKKHAFEIYKAFTESDTLEEAFGHIDQGVSMDYGVLERSDNVAVVPLDVGWCDLGSFDAFYDVFEKDEHNNISDVNTMSLNSTDNLIHSYSDKIIVTVGIEDLIVVDERDALLICKKDESQKVKTIVDQLKASGDIRTEYQVQDYRPWGKYKILEEEKDSFKIKRITVQPGKQLSYQRHHHRSEHWVVVRGMAEVTINDEIHFVSVGESIYVKAGDKHRLKNPGKVPVELIEVQIGEYLEEDDIIRFDDEYGRR